MYQQYKQQSPLKHTHIHLKPKQQQQISSLMKVNQTVSSNKEFPSATYKAPKYSTKTISNLLGHKSKSTV